MTSLRPATARRRPCRLSGRRQHWSLRRPAVSWGSHPTHCLQNCTRPGPTFGDPSLRREAGSTGRDSPVLWIPAWIGCRLPGTAWTWCHAGRSISVRVARSMRVPSVSAIVAMPCLMANLEHFLHPLRRNQARATVPVFWPPYVVTSAEFRARCVEVPPAVLTTITS